MVDSTAPQLGGSGSAVEHEPGAGPVGAAPGSPPSAGSGWRENRATGGARAIDPAELWTYRELVVFLALRDIKARYKQAVFGVGWAVLQPLLGAAVLTFVFARVTSVPSEGIPYPVFSLLGISVWNYFTASLNGATHSLVSNASLVTKVYFPRVLAPMAAMIPGLVGLFIGLCLVGVAMAVYGLRPPPAVFTVPLWVLLLMTTALGTGMLLATLNVRYRDVGQVFGLLTQLWLFASPVAYPSSQVPGAWRWVYFLNPMAGILDGFRWAILGVATPVAPVMVSVTSAVVVLWLGLRFFQRAERQFADLI